MLFDVHCSESYTAKSMLDELERKYNTEEVGSKSIMFSSSQGHQWKDSKHENSCTTKVLGRGSVDLKFPSECVLSLKRVHHGCLGALDGTHIEVRVPDSDKGHYRNRKCQISINVLGVCNTEGKFIYALSGWEGSAADGRVLRDAIHRPTGLKVPTGKYYLFDNGYSNVEGFLTPYRGVRYHLKEWDRG
ncbi:UNVERIFIED_CONTAM: hypothetical protein Scaly_0072800 [Sesamum calycinum]|uniref:DDE Tnp4 domain-containing protein n=1 Tax=Sesamum calycinum TaxID=2727403 RepID=A0AAW2SVW6_9LAMI